MSKGQYAQIETAFILNDQRLDDLSGNTFRLYITLWAYAVNQRTDTFRLANVGRTLGRLSRNDSRTIHFSLTHLQRLCLIERPDKNTIKVCGVKNKHPKLKWKDITQTEVRETVQKPNRIEKNRIEKNRIRAGSSKDNVSRETIDKIIEMFNEICISLAKVKSCNPKTPRYKSLVARIVDYPDLDWQAYFKRIEKSDKLTGKKFDWQATFDWIIKPTKMLQIIEGNHDNKEKEESLESQYNRAIADKS